MKRIRFSKRELELLLLAIGAADDPATFEGEGDEDAQDKAYQIFTSGYEKLRTMLARAEKKGAEQ